MKIEEGASGNAENFYFSIRPRPEKKSQKEPGSQAASR
jgi:hypothetical protein